jgi:cytochrome P450
MMDFLRNFLIAGRDTTAELLTWTVYMLSQNPDVETRVLTEIATVIGDAPLTYENVSQLKYLKAVLQEVLRLYPPGTYSDSLVFELRLPLFVDLHGIVAMQFPWMATQS